MIAGLALTVLAVIQGQAGVFPARTVLPLHVATGGNVAATSRLGATTLNPASAASAHGIEVGVVAYPETGLEGTSAAVAGGGRVRVVFGLWSFAVKDIIGDDLVDLDPSLGELTASSIGGTIGFALSHGRIGFGMLTSHRAQSIVGFQSSASALSAGVRIDARPIEVGVSLIDVPLGSPDKDVAPRRAAVVGVATTLRPGSAVAARIEVNAYAPDARTSEAFYGASAGLTIGNFEVLTGHGPTTGWGIGASVSWKRWRAHAATSLVSRDRLDRRAAFSVTYQ